MLQLVPSHPILLHHRIYYLHRVYQRYPRPTLALGCTYHTLHSPQNKTISCAAIHHPTASTKKYTIFSRYSHNITKKFIFKNKKVHLEWTKKFTWSEHFICITFLLPPIYKHNYPFYTFFLSLISHITVPQVPSFNTSTLPINTPKTPKKFLPKKISEKN